MAGLLVILRADEFPQSFAVLRTGSGKTHTIFGPPGVLTEHEYHQGAVRSHTPNRRRRGVAVKCF